ALDLVTLAGRAGEAHAHSARRGETERVRTGQGLIADKDDYVRAGASAPAIADRITETIQPAETGHRGVGYDPGAQAHRAAIGAGGADGGDAQGVGIRVAVVG